MKNLSKIKGRSSKIILLLLISQVLFLEPGCNSPSPAVNLDAPNTAVDSTACAPLDSPITAGDKGVAKVFFPDPLARSRNPGLSPDSLQLDDYLESVQLFHLKGNGVLQGSYIEVLNGIRCDWNFGAYDPKNHFLFSHGDWRFQEAMAYYFGDKFQSFLESIGYLQAGGVEKPGHLTANELPNPVQIVAHCESNDNAYFMRGENSAGKILEQVCLGDSVRTPGAFYGDDAIVTVHELQHATTADNYSPKQELNQFFYDEAGSLNEAISDVMGLIFTAPLISNTDLFDPRIFSRWALGTFDPKRSHLRGAHKCPVYDSSYPNCEGFPSFSIPQASNGNKTTISYVYPDGLGWPYPTNQKGSAAVARNTFLNFLSQEEIHNGGIVMAGALWDVYSAIKSNYNGDEAKAKRITSQLILEAVKHLPPANESLNHSPVTMVDFATNMVVYSSIIKGISSADQSAIQRALKARGLFDNPTITAADWLSVGPGTSLNILASKTPGIYVEDNPERLSKWLKDVAPRVELMVQGSPEVNHAMDPGEIVAVWFDLQNSDNLTAGGVLVTVTSTDPDIEILGKAVNIGYMTESGMNQAQIMYQKINGNAIVRTLNQRQDSASIPIGNTYFETNPFFNRNPRTAIWMKVHPDAAHGKVVNLEVTALPSNGVASKTIVPVTIQ